MRPDSTLNQLKAALPTGQFPSSYGVYFKNTMVALCHALEDHILQNRHSSEEQCPLVLVTFQQGKWYLQEADRYFELAQCSKHVAIAAVPDSGGDRSALSLEESFEKCQAQSGARFDPALVDSLGALVRLTEAGLMQLPTQPSELPTVWLEDTSINEINQTESEASR